MNKTIENTITINSDVPKILELASKGLTFYKGYEIPNPYDITTKEGETRDDYMMTLGLHRGFNEGFVVGQNPK